MPREAEIVASIADRYDHRQTLVDALSARIEMELGELEPDEAAVFMEELGIRESSLDRVIELSYRLLGLISFLTAGPDEVRAWPIRAGSTAVDAAAAIHSDLARGFIRAEVVAYEDLLALTFDGRGSQAWPPALRGPARTWCTTATWSRSSSAAELEGRLQRAARAQPVTAVRRPQPPPRVIGHRRSGPAGASGARAPGNPGVSSAARSGCSRCRRRASGTRRRRRRPGRPRRRPRRPHRHPRRRRGRRGSSRPRSATR